RRQGQANVQLAYDGLQLQVATEASARTFSLQISDSAAGLVVFNCAEEFREFYGPSKRGSVLAIGNFDGIHLGHQAILKQAVELAAKSGAVATALTFEPSPLKVLRPESAPKRISTPEQRLEWFRAVDVESAVVLPFTVELSRLTPQEFVEQILVGELQVRAVLVGENFRFGHKQAGDTALLRQLGATHRFDVIALEPVAAH